MIILGADLKSDHAIITIIDGNKDSFKVIKCKDKQIDLADSTSTKEVRSFKAEFEKTLKEHKVEKVIVKKRMERGMYASRGSSFKIEGLIQLNDVCEVEFLLPQKIKANRKKNPVDLPKELDDYQEASFETAYAYLKQNK